MRLKILQAILLMLVPGMGLLAQSAAPKELKLPRYEKAPLHQLIAAEFYPLGFSQDGNFAYAIAPADEACGCYFFEFRIQDLVTDKLLYRFDYRSDEGPNSPQYDNLEALWAAKSADFEAKMRQYHIVQKVPAFDSSFADFQVRISPREFSDPDMSDTKFIRSAQVQVQAPARGRKTVARLRFDNLYVKKVEAVGYFRSPVEDRVALLVARIDRGWEGLPRVLDLEVIGVHLTKGFR